MYVSMYLFIHLCIYQCLSLSICLSIYLFFYLSIFLSIYPCIYIYCIRTFQRHSCPCRRRIWQFCVCMYMFIHMYIYAIKCIRICIHIYSFIHHFHERAGKKTGGWGKMREGGRERRRDGESSRIRVRTHCVSRQLIQESIVSSLSVYVSISSSFHAGLFPPKAPCISKRDMTRHCGQCIICPRETWQCIAAWIQGFHAKTPT